MGDSYHPPPQRGRYDDRDYNRDYRSSRYSPARDRHGGDGYRRSGHHGGDEYREHEYNFRGAAGDTYRPPQSTFDFHPVNAPRAPRFPQEPPPPRDQPLPSRPRRDPARGRGRGRGGHGKSGPRKFFTKAPAHQRAILNFAEDEGAPQQFLGGAEDGHAKFVDVDTSDSDESDEEDVSATAPSRKRVKTSGAAVSEGSERPKWSNPDPYSVLPPTNMDVAPKKDIIQTIRKAKVEAANQAGGTNSIKDNDDFISFDFGEDKPAADDVSSDGDDNDFVGASAPVAPPKKSRTRNAQAPATRNNGTKRKFDTTDIGVDDNGSQRELDAADMSVGNVVPEWRANGTDPTPWLKVDDTSKLNVGLQLHKEIVDFYAYVQPRDYEERCRHDLIDRVERAVRSSKGGSTTSVRSFGSFPSGLYLPTADMDLVALSQEYVKNGQKRYCQNPRNMHALSAKLEYWQVAKRGTCAVIGRAKVPLVKFVDAKTNLRVDISFENDSGIRAIDTFLAWKEQYPQMPKLVVIIKQFLAMRGLNEVFSGGIGGFTIICLVTSMFQLMPETQGNGAELGYGELLLNFFDLYGNKFDVKEVGIMMNPPRYFSKGRDHVDAKINQTGLTIIDPNRPDNDISGGSREILKVLNAFRAAHAAIQRRLDSIRTGEVPTGSILGCILGGNYTSFQNQRNLLFSLQNDQTSARPSSPPGLPPPSFGWQSLNHPSLPPYPPPTYPPPTQQYQGYLQQQPQYGTPGSYPPQYQSSDPQRLQHPLPPPPPSGAVSHNETAKKPKPKKSKARKKAQQDATAKQDPDTPTHLTGLKEQRKKLKNLSSTKKAARAAKLARKQVKVQKAAADKRDAKKQKKKTKAVAKAASAPGPAAP